MSRQQLKLTVTESVETSYAVRAISRSEPLAEQLEPFKQRETVTVLEMQVSGSKQNVVTALRIAAEQLEQEMP